MNVRFLSQGDTALVAEFGDRIERTLNDRVLRLRTLVDAADLPGVIETIPTFRSLLIRYDPLATGSASVAAAVERLLDQVASAKPDATLWRIPACYSEHHAPDLEQVAARTGLETPQVVRLHSGTRFQVYMLGFVPGFPYLGDLPEPLVLPRRTDPRVRVPAGSIAIATRMSAIYPLESPGGWHLIGASPVRLFDASWPRPALMNPGDLVEFEPVTDREFDTIRADVAAGTYRIRSETIAA